MARGGAAHGPAARVALIGFMGSGKSTVGALLAARIGWEFADLDAAIELRAGEPIAAIFRGRGESTFRALESECLRGLVVRTRMVIAAGGGAPMQAENLPFFRDPLTAVFFLHVSLAQALARTAGDASRPLLSQDAEAVRRLYETRLGRYRELGSEIVTGGRTPEEVAREIVDMLGGPPALA